MVFTIESFQELNIVFLKQYGNIGAFETLHHR
jgi:hypothetical protein